MRLYFYCIMKNISNVDFSLKGLDNQKIFFIRNKDLYGVVSAVSTMQYEDTIINRGIHNKIIEYLSERYSILPFRFNSIVGERVGRGIIKRYYEELQKNLVRIQNKVEFVVRVLKRDSSQIDVIQKAVIGKDKIKKSARKSPISKILNIKGKVLANQINQPLRDLSSDSYVEMLCNEQLLINGYYLIDRKNIRLFQGKLNDMEKVYSRYEFMRQGPMPPYSFNIVDITKDNAVKLRKL